MADQANSAPGAPGLAPRWTTSSKVGVGTAAGLASRVWFTLARGIVTEVFYPRVDLANSRDAGFLVAADGFFSEEKRDTKQTVEPLDAWAPAYRLRNTCRQGRYTLTKEVLTDPERNVLLQRVQFAPGAAAHGGYRLYFLVAPHLANYGAGNHAWVADYNGEPFLFAARGDAVLAVACSRGFVRRSVGFVGVSDGWQDVHQHGALTWQYERADDGNVALTGEIEAKSDQPFVMAMGFGRSAGEAAQQARASLLKGFDRCRDEYIAEWRAATKGVRDLAGASGDSGRLFRSSVQVLLTCRDKSMPGAAVASLSIPWGATKGDNDLGGYHLVWARDLVEGASALLAVDDVDRAWQTLLYLASIQRADGSWPQNNWLDGEPYWQGVQLDETAYPLCLAWRLREEAARRGFDLWPLAKRAAGYLARTGPVTPEERWEEDGGYSPSTLAVCISGLLCAADLGRQAGDAAAAEYLEAVADWWASDLDDWTFTTAGDLLPGHPRYYQRLGVPTFDEGADGQGGAIPIRNEPPGQQDQFPARDVVDGGFLQLVRYGVRRADDPNITATLPVIDAVLKVELPCGPAWHRYNHDGYGEHANGAPFDGSGVGRAWPLLGGERAHYALAAGDAAAAQRLARAMECFANEGAFLPEQVWDSDDIPDRGLQRGRPSGSAMPLVWAHAEYVKLLRSLADQHVFDLLPPVARRYQGGPPAPRAVWRFNHKIARVGAGEPLRVEALAPMRLHWSADGWQTVQDSEGRASGFGTWYVDLPREATADAGSALAFTFYWPEAERWEGRSFTLHVEAA